MLVKNSFVSSKASLLLYSTCYALCQLALTKLNLPFLLTSNHYGHWLGNNIIYQSHCIHVSQFSNKMLHILQLHEFCLEFCWKPHFMPKLLLDSPVSVVLPNLLKLCQTTAEITI